MTLGGGKRTQLGSQSRRKLTERSLGSSWMQSRGFPQVCADPWTDERSQPLGQFSQLAAGSGSGNVSN